MKRFIKCFMIVIVLLVISGCKNNSIYGYYKSGILDQKLVCGELNGIERDFETTEIFLNKDGTFKRVYHSVCDGANQTGTFKINKDELVLTCDEKSEQCINGEEIVFEISKNGELKSKDFNETYKKVKEDELQYLEK